MVKCKECSKEFKANSGLSSHMRMQHRMNVDGSPVPDVTIQAQITKALKAKDQLRSVASQQAYAKQKASGPYTCPECSKYKHKKVEFPTPSELGKHRRFTHGVLGKSKTAIKSRESLAPAGDPTMFECPHCHRKFANRLGLVMHIGKKHKTTSLTIQPVQEMSTNANGTRNGIHQHQPGEGHPNGKDIAHATAEALIVAYATGILKGQITAIAEVHDFPARQLTFRCAQSLLSEAKR